MLFAGFPGLPPSALQSAPGWHAGRTSSVAEHPCSLPHSSPAHSSSPLEGLFCSFPFFFLSINNGSRLGKRVHSCLPPPRVAAGGCLTRKQGRNFWKMSCFQQLRPGAGSPRAGLYLLSSALSPLARQVLGARAGTTGTGAGVGVLDAGASRASWLPAPPATPCLLAGEA